MRLESRFSHKSWKEYVESPRPPPLVFQPERAGQDVTPTLEVDKVRCRMSALSAPLCKEFPVFCSLDSIVPAVSGQLADFSFIATVRDKRLSALNLLPWVGAGWHARPAAEVLLHRRVITWDDITWSFQATADRCERLRPGSGKDGGGLERGGAGTWPQ